MRGTGSDKGVELVDDDFIDEETALKDGNKVDLDVQLEENEKGERARDRILQSSSEKVIARAIFFVLTVLMISVGSLQKDGLALTFSPFVIGISSLIQMAWCLTSAFCLGTLSSLTKEISTHGTGVTAWSGLFLCLASALIHASRAESPLLFVIVPILMVCEGAILTKLQVTGGVLISIGLLLDCFTLDKTSVEKVAGGLLAGISLGWWAVTATRVLRENQDGVDLLTRVFQLAIVTVVGSYVICLVDVWRPGFTLSVLVLPVGVMHSVWSLFAVLILKDQPLTELAVLFATSLAVSNGVRASSLSLTGCALTLGGLLLYFVPVGNTRSRSRILRPSLRIQRCCSACMWLFLLIAVTFYVHVALLESLPLEESIPPPTHVIFKRFQTTLENEVCEKQRAGSLGSADSPKQVFLLRVQTLTHAQASHMCSIMEALIEKNKIDCWIALDTHDPAKVNQTIPILKAACNETYDKLNIFPYTFDDILNLYPAMRLIDHRCEKWGLTWGYHVESIGVWYHHYRKTLCQDLDYLWVTEPDIGITGPPEAFFASFSSLHSDLVTSRIRVAERDWMWLGCGSDEYEHFMSNRTTYRSNEHLQRFSRNFLSTLTLLSDRRMIGWSEDSVINFCMHLSFKCENIPSKLVGSPFSFNTMLNEAQWNSIYKRERNAPVGRIYHALKF